MKNDRITISSGPQNLGTLSVKPLVAYIISHQVTTRIINADCTIALKTLPEESIDLIMTSPPYADQRKHTYGGIPADKYVAWFLPIADDLHRVLKPSGSFVLNIKEHAAHGERHTYVMEMILEMRKRGWVWTEEYVWHLRHAGYLKELFTWKHSKPSIPLDEPRGLNKERP